MKLSGFNKGSNTARTDIIKKFLSTEFTIQIRPFSTKGANPDGSGGFMEVIASANSPLYPVFAKRLAAALTKKIGPNEDILEEADVGNIS